ncbi:hypothetical protein [Marinicrinis sediminis]|uniref:GNAT family N-acetyltransferase n=1 Tax=Marinicrinis sediminis TaxID=1652465 RepID=A0ABW5RA87_9BACL
MQIRSYMPNDIEGVRTLYEARGLQFDPSLFQWKKQAPVQMSWVAEEEGVLYAHYAMIEMPFKPKARVAFAVDGIFHPERTTLPFIADMLEHALHWARDEAKLDAVMAFANNKMGPVKRLLGWQPFGTYQAAQTNGNARGEERLSLSPSLADQQTSCSNSDYPSIYEAWRFLASPRRYHYMKGQERHYWFTESQWLLSPVEDFMAEAVQLNEKTFHYMARTREGISGKMTEKNPAQTEMWTPLYKPLSKQAEAWEPPPVWPFETVEGVTLGW